MMHSNLDQSQMMKLQLQLDLSEDLEDRVEFVHLQNIDSPMTEISKEQ